MSLEELFPGRLPLSFRRWLDAVPFQNVPDRVVCQIVTQVGQCSLYPSIAPGAILLSHATAKAAISLRVGCRPGVRHGLPARFSAINFRCHVNRVSGAAMVAT